LNYEVDNQQLDEASGTHELYGRAILVGDIENACFVVKMRAIPKWDVENEVFSNKKDANSIF